MRRTTEVSASAAFGAGIGAIIAIVLSQYIVLGTIIGAFAGAFVGGLSFQPWEIWQVVRRVWRERWREIAWSSAVIVGVATLIVAIMRWPTTTIFGACGALVIAGAVIGWRYRVNIGRAVRWFVVELGRIAEPVAGHVLGFVCTLGAFLSGGVLLLLVIALPSDWSGGYYDILTGGFLLSVSSWFVLALTGGVLYRVVRDYRRKWLWMVSRAMIGRYPHRWLFSEADYKKGAVRESSLTFKGWGALRINGQLVRPRGLLRLLVFSGMLAAGGFSGLPLLVALVVSIIVDVPLTIALALASSQRLAVMEGAFLGALVGSVAFHANASTAAAVAIGMIVGAAVGVGCYRLRAWLERPVAATA